MTHFIYIIQSEADLSFYIGQTQDIDQRLKKHNQGYSVYTRHLRPWRILAYKEVDLRSEAMKIEKKLKNLKSREKIMEFIAQHNFIITNI
jgi:putative endonuclease